MPTDKLRTRSREVETRKGLAGFNQAQGTTQSSIKRTSELSTSSSSAMGLGRINSSKINNQNSFKHIEQIQIEGNFKLKKVFSSRS